MTPDCDLCREILHALNKHYPNSLTLGQLSNAIVETSRLADNIQYLQNAKLIKLTSPRTVNEIQDHLKAEEQAQITAYGIEVLHELFSYIEE